MNRDLNVSSIRKLNNVIPDIFLFPFSDYRKSLSIERMVRADNSDLIEVAVTMRCVISMR